MREEAIRGLIIEADQCDPNRQDMRTESEVAYYIEGYSPEGLAYMQRNITSLVLGALACEDLSHEQAADLLSDLVTRKCVMARSRADFEVVLAYAPLYARKRFDALVAAAANGAPSEALANEGAEVLSFGDALQIDGPSPVECITAEGFHGNINEDGIRADIIEEPCEEGIERQFELALGTNAFVWSDEVITTPRYRGESRILSQREHLTLGHMNEGVFTPIVTVLDRSDQM